MGLKLRKTIFETQSIDHHVLIMLKVFIIAIYDATIVSRMFCATLRDKSWKNLLTTSSRINSIILVNSQQQVLNPRH